MGSEMCIRDRNVPRSDGFSPAQLLFGRAQRTSLPTLSSQITPIDFHSAASSKDAAHARAKLDHDRSKISLSLLSPGQDVFMQDSKSLAWDRRGVIFSIRPDRLSYVVQSDGRYFTRPRRLLRPVPSDTPFPPSSSSDAQVSSPVLPRCSLRLQSRSTSALVQFSTSSSSPTRNTPSTSSPSWPHYSSATDRALWTIQKGNARRGVPP